MELRRHRRYPCQQMLSGKVSGAGSPEVRQGALGIPGGWTTTTCKLGAVNNDLICVSVAMRIWTTLVQYASTAQHIIGNVWPTNNAATVPNFAFYEEWQVLGPFQIGTRGTTLIAITHGNFH